MSNNTFTSKNGVQVMIHPDSHPHRMDLVEEVVSLMTVPTDGSTIYRETVDLGRVIGVDHLVELKDGCKVYETRRPIFNGDGTIRKYRDGVTPMVLNQEPADTTQMTIVICVAREPEEFVGKWVVVTMFEGAQGMPEPWDAKCKDDPELKAASRKFWATHALVPTEREWQIIAQELFDEMQKCHHQLGYNC